jgi:hypothetical protein
MLGAINWVPRWFRHPGAWSAQELADAMSEILDRAVSTQPSRALSQHIGSATSVDLPATTQRKRKSR